MTKPKFGDRSPSGPSDVSLIERASARHGFAPRPVSAAARRRADENLPEPMATGNSSAPAHVDADASVDPPLAPLLTAVSPLRPKPAHESIVLDRAVLGERGLINPDAPTTLLAEEFRAIKRPILLDAFGARTHDAVERGRMVLVGSPRPGDGKSFCAANLALSLASEKDVAVLLVDADFAKPTLPELFGIDAGRGLLDALRDPRLDVEGLVRDTDMSGLSLLTAGSGGRDDTELLASRRAGEVLERLLLADPRRMLVFDTPPVLVASPAAVLARHCGQILLVVRADRTTETDVAHAVDAFGSEAKLHLMLNAVSFTAGGRRFGSPYGYGDAR